ncbi:MAG: MFS transporter [Pseudomonadota bacterium]
MTLRIAWLAVAAMFFQNGALFGMWASRIPAVAEAYHLGHAQLGVLLLFLAGGAVCAFPLAGKAIDRFGASGTARAIAILYPLSLIILPLSPGFAILAAALFLFGAAHGAMDVAMNGWGAEVERRFDRPVMSTFHAMWSLGAGLGALSGVLATSVAAGIGLHFLLASIAVTVPCLWLGRISWNSVRAQPNKGAPLFALPTGLLFFVGVLAFCASLGEGAVADWSAVYLRDVAAVSESQAALGYAAFSVAMVAVRLAGDQIIRWLGPVVAARIGGAFAAVGSLVVVLAPALATALPGFALMGIGYAVIMPLAFSRAANDPTIPQGQALASVATLGYGGLLLGPPAIGAIAGFVGLQQSFLLLVALSVLIVILAGSLRR